MRTLSRPMFNMGGPIKQGVMHGIREPKKHGGPTGTGLVGDQRYPKTAGREHHGFFIPPLLLSLGLGTGARVAGGAAVRAAGSAAARRAAQEAATRAALSGGVSQTAKNVAGAGATGWKNLFKNYWSADPGVKGVKWAGKTLTSPTANTWAQKAVRGLLSPSSLALSGGITWYMWPDGTKRKTPPPGNMIGAGPLHGVKDPTPSIPEPTVKSQAEKDAFAKSQREKRVNKYLDLMGYDRSKKLAIADALIDASKIVGDRGTLDLKNITQELISPVIQATSKRLDKPQQIREAVGLMMTKAGLEKEMYDAKPGTMMKNIQDLVASGMSEQEAKDIVLKQSKGVGSDIMGFMASQKGKVKPEQLENIARLSANDHKVPFSKITDEEVAAIPALEGKTALEIVTISAKTDGIYMVGDTIIEVKGGKPIQLTFG